MQLASAARSSKEHLELLCRMCARLEGAVQEVCERSGGNGDQQGDASDAREQSAAERQPLLLEQADVLLQDADAMLTSLDKQVKDCMSEQERLEAALNEVSGGLQKQIVEVHETMASVVDRRSQLQEEKDQLIRRLEEVSMHLDQLAETQRACEREERELKSKLRETTNAYEGDIAASFCKQRGLADEKLRAVVCKECAHSILDVVKRHCGQQKEHWLQLLERRQADLRQHCAKYIHQERLQVEAAGECFVFRTPKTTQAKVLVQGSDDLSDLATQALTFAQESWQRAQAMLRVVEPLLGTRMPKGMGEEALQQSVAAESSSKEQKPVLTDDDSSSFFAHVAAQVGHKCVDCGIPEADWASVSHGTYLCMDCAGKHRGLGVHLSFVRSTTMDIWSKQQLQRMQLGGNSPFLQFIEGYPELSKPTRTAAELQVKYSSRAAAHYRRRLDAACDGTAFELEAPPRKEGHLAATESAASSTSLARPSYANTKKPENSAAAAAAGTESSVGTLEEEKAALEKAYIKHQHQLQMSVAPPSGEQQQDQTAPQPQAPTGAANPGLPDDQQILEADDAVEKI